MLLLLAGCLINEAVYEARKAELTDADGDGFAQQDECDDADPSVFPGAEERCDGVDDDCDGTADNDAVDASEWFPDRDGDGHGADEPGLLRCGPEGDTTASNQDDCDDQDATSHPGADEVAYDGVDQDCSGADLDDLDGDGHLAASDCDDSDAESHPDGDETWANAFVDNDCDGDLDQDSPLLFGDSLWYSTVPDAQLGARVSAYPDLDGDGDGEIVSSAVGTSRTFEQGGAVYVLGLDGEGDVDTDALRTLEAGGVDWHLGVATDIKDLDGDGLPEMLASATGISTAGAGFLVRGADLRIRDLRLPEDASHAFYGTEANTYWGSDIAFLGDIDGDGSEEVAISATGATAGGMAGAGRVAVFSLANEEHATDNPDYEWSGYYDGGRIGETVRTVGDVDHDGLADTLVSAQQGDILVVLPWISGPVDEVCLARVTRDGVDSAYRPVVLGNLDGAEGRDVALLADDHVLLFTGLGTFGLRSQADAWMTITASEGSAFSDAVDLGDRTGDGVPETLLTRTWSPADATSWAGVLLSDALGWHNVVDAQDIDIAALSTRTHAGLGYRAAHTLGSEEGLALGGYTDDRGAVGAGSVAVVRFPE